jgi:hypothetical protein
MRLTFDPSILTLHFRSTRIQCGNSSSIFTIVCFSTVSFSVLSSSVIHLPSRAVVSSLLERKAIVPPPRTLLYRSTRNQLGNSTPTCAIVLLYCILQLDTFCFCPYTLACGLLIGLLGVHGFVPSTLTLWTRSSWNQRGNSNSICLVLISFCVVFWDGAPGQPQHSVA